MRVDGPEQVRRSGHANQRDGEGSPGANGAQEALKINVNEGRIRRLWRGVLLAENRWGTPVLVDLESADGAAGGQDWDPA